MKILTQPEMRGCLPLRAAFTLWLVDLAIDRSLNAGKYVFETFLNILAGFVFSQQKEL
jgi:hypothetical protein